MKPAYTDIRVLKAIYVSSAGHYCAHVRYTHRRRRRTRDVTLSDVGVMYMKGMGEIVVPAYVTQEIARQVLEMMADGSASYYEYNRDGEKRYECLRYHAQENVDWILKCLRPKAEGRHGRT